MRNCPDGDCGLEGLAQGVGSFSQGPGRQWGQRGVGRSWGVSGEEPQCKFTAQSLTLICKVPPELGPGRLQAVRQRGHLAEFLRGAGRVCARGGDRTGPRGSASSPVQPHDPVVLAGGRQPGGRRAVGGSGLAFLLVQCVARVYREQVAHSPARWPSWGFSSWPQALMPGSDRTAEGCSQDLGWWFLGPLGASGSGASRACLRMSSA